MPWSAAAAAVAGAVATSALSDSGSPSGSSQSTVSNDPWGGVQPYLLDIFGRAQTQSYQNPIAPQSAQTGQAQSILGARAFQNSIAGTPMSNAANAENINTIGGAYLSPDSNPYLRGAVEQAMDQAKRGVSSQFKGDNYGSSANQEWLGKSLAGAALPIYAQNYQTERGRQQAATQLAPAFNQAIQYGDAGVLGQVGAQRDARSQQEIDAPWAALRNYQGLVSGQPGGTSTATNPMYSNPAATALGGGIAGLNMFSGLKGLLGGGQAFNPATSYNAAGTFQPFYDGMGIGGYQFG